MDTLLQRLWYLLPVCGGNVLANSCSPGNFPWRTGVRQYVVPCFPVFLLFLKNADPGTFRFSVQRVTLWRKSGRSQSLKISIHIILDSGAGLPKPPPGPLQRRGRRASPPSFGGGRGEAWGEAWGGSKVNGALCYCHRQTIGGRSSPLASAALLSMFFWRTTWAFCPG